MALFLLLFAATYFLMAAADPDSFNVDVFTRTDSLYVTVTVFATVGFGDITATSQTARAFVSAQMILDLIVLGLLVRCSLAPSNSAGMNRQRRRRSARKGTEPRRILTVTDR